ncbi:MAG TPA: hypothetical protein PK358_14845 [Spirochaetota bacterium]|nr:hypothetical protein [Spirochaetota bacterium]HPJ36115.1 hypothetical protein [Spirochaetota bacterium]
MKISRRQTMMLPLFLTMSAAFIFGYIDQILPLNFERLHIFLFNLTSGGFTILYLTSGKKRPSTRIALFYIISIAFALLAFIKLYLPAAVCGVVLAVIVETYRLERFSFFPSMFFRIKDPASAKFHHASLLCLVIALLMSSFVIINEVYLNLFHFEKLTLDVFFLGFSFPVSLITMSIMFGIIENKDVRWLPAAEHAFFWLICGGVIIFFIFIIMKSFAGEVFISFTLFFTVVMIFAVFFRYGRRIQQKYFLVSGIYFLMATAVTGILYILMKHFSYNEFHGKLVLRMHAFYSLYGWNLTGMMVITKWEDFPIALNTGKAIFFHWCVILILAPLAKFYPVLAIPAIVSYLGFIAVFFFSRNRIKKEV